MSKDWIPEEEYQRMINVLTEVSLERKRQHGLHGRQDRPPGQYGIILHEEVGEASKEICEAEFSTDPEHRLSCYRKLRAELIQVAAVAVAMVECLDRNELHCLTFDIGREGFIFTDRNDQVYWIASRFGMYCLFKWHVILNRWVMEGQIHLPDYYSAYQARLPQMTADFYHKLHCENAETNNYPIPAGNIDPSFMLDLSQPTTAADHD
jgi:hypothetical protein